MSKNTSSILNISLALLFAGMMLLASFILEDTNHGQTVTHLLIAVWFSLMCIPNRKHCSDQKAVGINACNKTAS